MTISDSSTTGPNAGIDVAIDAARAGNIAVLKAWLDSGNYPNQYAKDGWTPLLWASVRGHAEAVKLLLDNKKHPADIDMRHRDSGALPIHFAGHSGSIPTAEILLDRKPEHLNNPWDFNGHSILLQAVFYGHLDLVKVLLKRGADTAITSSRGLGPMEMTTQFQNQAMMDLIRPYDKPAEAKAAYYKTYLARIAPVIPENEKAAQQLSDQLVSAIETGLKSAAKDAGSVAATLARIKDLVEVQKADVNRLGGPLQQPPLVVTVTGNNGLPVVPAMVELRNKIAQYLLDQGADPTNYEKHPMGAHTIIRAAVFNHLDILKMCAKKISPKKLADALNEIPLVNGLTALHDTVLRSTMAKPDHFEGYLDQTRWCVSSGARSDIEDFSGRTQRNIAEGARDGTVKRRLLDVLDGK